MNNFTNGYALLIGVGESLADPELIPSLPATVNDTKAIHAALIDQELCGYAEDNIRLLINADATKANILEGLKWLAEQDSQATIFIYYSGHGCVDKNNKDRYYLLQHDIVSYKVESGKKQLDLGSALPADDFKEALRQIKAERLLVVIDSCHAAGMAASKSKSPKEKEFKNFQLINPSKGLVSEWQQGKGRVVLTSSQGEQDSWTTEDNTMSIYTVHFLEALKGAGNKPGDTEVTVFDLMTYLSKTVPKTAQDLGIKQDPNFDFNTTNFAIANLRGGKGLPEKGYTEKNTPKPSLNIDWRAVCQKALDTRNKRLTTNPFTSGDDIEFELDDIYVPLGLVEKVKKDQISGEISPESGSQIFQPEEVRSTYKNKDEFFTQVLKKGKSHRSQGRKLAIVGKSGAGKTTLLQKIAQWVMDEKEYVAIWVSLAGLRGKTLEEYLLQSWLEKNVLPEVDETEVTPEMEKALKSLLKSGRVFLLLDGIDEMTSRNPLAKLEEEISSGWLASTRVVVTCRQNVWDAGINSLEGFDVYRNLDFEYPDGMKTFIQRWFAKKPELGEQLMEELGQAGKERIRDMVRNPLRLALLCRAWQVHQGNLPKTKAGLYKQFTDTLYDWKSNNHKDNQKNLNIALSKLALRGMEQSECRFRFKEGLVIEFLGNKGDTLFELALELGWLNKGVATENPDEQVYAFYHPTFQEYFAALAINDWSYFLKHVPNNPSEGTYRIFEKHWKEVILLWFGRDDVEKEKKEAFIENLINFDDGCGDWNNELVDKGFYEYRAYFLAGAIVREFKESRWGDVIVDQIVDYCTTLDVIQEEAKAVLLETDRQRAINSLIKLLEQTSDQNKHWIITNCLRDIAVEHEGAINSLIKLLEQTSDQDTKWIIAYCLYDIAVEHEGAINSLSKLDPQTSDQERLRIMTDCWSKIVVQNKKEINRLQPSETPDQDTPGSITDSLDNILLGDDFLIKLLPQTSSLGKMLQNKELYYKAIFDLKQNLNNEIYQNKFDLYQRSYKLTGKFIENLNYQEFYKAWNTQQTSSPKLPNNPVYQTPLTELLKKRMMLSCNRHQPY